MRRLGALGQAVPPACGNPDRQAAARCHSVGVDAPLDVSALGPHSDRLSEVAILPACAPRAARSGRLPGAGRVPLGPVGLGPGRPVAAAGPGAGDPVLWLSDAAVSDPALLWWTLAERFPTTGLWPLMLTFLGGEAGRPWEVGEFYPATEADVDALDARQVLETGWHGGVVPINNPWPPEPVRWHRSARTSRGSRHRSPGSMLCPWFCRPAAGRASAW